MYGNLQEQHFMFVIAFSSPRYHYSQSYFSLCLKLCDEFTGIFFARQNKNQLYIQVPKLTRVNESLRNDTCLRVFFIMLKTVRIRFNMKENVWKI